MNENTIYSNAVTNITPHLRMIYECFGYEQTVLVPTKLDGTPDVLQPAKYTLAQSHSTEMQRKLSIQPVAAVFGPQSNNLGCIVCQEDNLEDFLTKNPALRDTTQQRFKNVVRLFVRIEGPCRDNKGAGSVAWINNGNLVIHSPERNSGYEFLTVTQPCSISFDSIVWPPELAWQFAIEKLAAEHPVAILDRRGKEILNDHFVLGYFRLSNAVKYDPSGGIFYRLVDKKSQTIFPETVKAQFVEILQLLQKASNRRVHVDTSPRHLKVLVELLKVVVAAPVPEKQASVPLFVSTCLVGQTGKDVTSTELHDAYQGFCIDNGVLAVSDHQFHRQIEAAIQGEFGISRSNSLKRESSSHRGFRNLVIKAVSERSGTVGTRGTGQTFASEQIAANIVRMFEEA